MMSGRCALMILNVVNFVGGIAVVRVCVNCLLDLASIFSLKYLLELLD